jgi:glucosamine--fructose-6-phosphate aminotransferase (isomerizing)
MEMLEQPEAVARSLNYGARLMGGENRVKLGGLDDKREKLCEIESLIIAACGTSLNAGKYGEYLMRELGCFKYVESIVASEIFERDFPKRNAGFLSISQSGETMDLLIPFRLAKKHGLQRINLVNKVNSTLARENDCGVFLNCGREFSVASTKAYVCQVTCMTLVALWFSQNKNFNATKKLRAKTINELKMLSANMKATLENINDKSGEIAKQLKGARHIFFCGTGISEYVAREGALKMKEMTYLHCQNIQLHSIGNNFFTYLVKHPRTPVIFIVLDSQKNKSQYIDDMAKLLTKTNSLGVVVTDIKEKAIFERLHQLSEGRIMSV